VAGRSPRVVAALLPGAIAAATHALIRTDNVLRALENKETESRVRELWYGTRVLGGSLSAVACRTPAYRGSWPMGGPSETPAHRESGTAVPGHGCRSWLVWRLWPDALEALCPPADPEHVPAELDALVEATVGQYLEYGRAEPVMLVHAATAPAAAAAALPLFAR